MRCTCAVVEDCRPGESVNIGLLIGILDCSSSRRLTNSDMTSYVRDGGGGSARHDGTDFVFDVRDWMTFVAALIGWCKSRCALVDVDGLVGKLWIELFASSNMIFRSRTCCLQRVGIAAFRVLPWSSWHASDYRVSDSGPKEG